VLTQTSQGIVQQQQQEEEYQQQSRFGTKIEELN